MIHIHLEILTANTLSEVALLVPPQEQTNNDGTVGTGIPALGTVTPATENLAVQCFDKDKQSWMLEVMIWIFLF